MEQKTEDSLPEVIELSNPEESLQYYFLLEAFSDSMGNWRVMDVFGRPIVELPDALVADLLQLRHVAEVIRNQKDRAGEGGVVRPRIPVR